MNEEPKITYGVSTARNVFNEVRPSTENYELFQAVVECFGESTAGWLKVKRLGLNNPFYEIASTKIHPRLAPKFLIGEEVFVPIKSLNAKIFGIGGHFKRNEYIYTLSFNNKKNSRRYFVDELEKFNS